MYAYLFIYFFFLAILLVGEGRPHGCLERVVDLRKDLDAMIIRH